MRRPFVELLKRRYIFYLDKPTNAIQPSLQVFKPQRQENRKQKKARWPRFVRNTENTDSVKKKTSFLPRELPEDFPIPIIQWEVTWNGINYSGRQVTQWDFQNKGTRTSAARLSFVLEVPLCNLRPRIIDSVPCDRIMQRVYCTSFRGELRQLVALASAPGPPKQAFNL